MDLSDLKSNENRYRVSSVIHTYDLHTTKRLDEITWCSAEKILNDMLCEIILQKNMITEPQVKVLFKKTVSKLECLLKTSPLDGGDGSGGLGLYGYAGLNNFFAEILEALNFEVKWSENDYMIDFVYGMNFAEFDDESTE